jgi:hypothetical protein
MLRNEDVSFPAEGGIELSGWLFVPGEDGPLPAITMAHGYAWTKYHGIEPTAEAFAEAGFAVLLHDHRGFMDLGTTPRSQRKCSSRGASAPATSAAFPVVGGRSRDVAGPNDPGLALCGQETRPRQSPDPGIYGRDVGTTGPTLVRHDTRSERRSA